MFMSAHCLYFNQEQLRRLFGKLLHCERNHTIGSNIALLQKQYLILKCLCLQMFTVAFSLFFYILFFIGQPHFVHYVGQFSHTVKYPEQRMIEQINVGSKCI